MNRMNLPDGPGWSPDGGKFWVKGDRLFWHDGGVWDMTDGGMIRTMPGIYDHYEDYSSWTDEQRAAVYNKAKAAYVEAVAAGQRRDDERAVLRESARAKLTPEEWEACVSY